MWTSPASSNIGHPLPVCQLGCVSLKEAAIESVTDCTVFSIQTALSQGLLAEGRREPHARRECTGRVQTIELSLVVV